jgi:hypothetical protein
VSKTQHLRHTQYEGLSFGPENEIQFGIKGGFPPGEIVISEDHPLYDELWAAEGPYLEVVDDAKGAKVYVSPIEPDREFKSKAAMVASVRAAAKAGNSMARMWLEQQDIPVVGPPKDEDAK